MKSSHTGNLAQRGAVLTEFAVSAGVFLMLLIGGLDLLRMAYKYVQLQHVIEEVSREAALGLYRAAPQGEIEKIRLEIVARTGLSLDQNLGAVTTASFGPACDPARVPNCDRNLIPNSWFIIKVNAPIGAVARLTGISLKASALNHMEPDFSLGVFEPPGFLGG